MIKKISLLLFVMSIAFYCHAQDSQESGPVLSFLTNGHNFGKIPIDSMPENRQFSLEIDFANTGDEPLVVMNVRACCGTRVTDWTKNPILPGESGTISILFTLRQGAQRISRTVTATSNCIEQNAKIFRLSGEVVE